MPNTKPILTPARRERIRLALKEAAYMQTNFWNALGELEGAAGFDFSMADVDLSHYEDDVDAFVESAWEKRDG